MYKQVVCNDSKTKLGKIFARKELPSGDNSGFIILRNGRRALDERLKLVEMAECTINAQYYIWNSDKSGTLLLQELVKAAERDVMVRILLDDFSIDGNNDELLLLNSHPNIEIRVYNPFKKRSSVGKLLNLAFDFKKLNRRSHNKTFVVDGTVAVTGGRNIGDEYFDLSEQINFSDVDLLSIGPVVSQISASFDDYWDSKWAVPLEQILHQSYDSKDKSILCQLLEVDLQETSGLTFSEGPGFVEKHFQDIREELIWAPALFLADMPGEEANSDTPKRVARKIIELAKQSNNDILIESAYFVLNNSALKHSLDLIAKGVRIRVLTNSMSSNDVLPNHVSYAMVRGNMLDSGIELYELRPDAASCEEFVEKKEFYGEDSQLGLHAKAAVFDHTIVYIGSMNLNLRSAYLNTESAMIIESSVLAEQLTKQIEINLRETNSWRVFKNGGGVKWVTKKNGEYETFFQEPSTTWLERAKAMMLKFVPGALYY